MNVLLKMLKKVIKGAVILLIKFYQKVISPWTPASCRYSPTCSSYSIEAFKKYGILKAFILTVKRISSCHPWGGHGHDPLP